MSSPVRRPRIGLLGGTFDPPTSAHIKLAERAIEHFRLDSVALIVAADPWQKSPLASAKDRFAMTVLATRGHPKIEVWDIELQRQGRSTYTVDTLRQLHKQFPGTDFVFIIGSDVDTSTWRDEAECRRLAEFVRVRRSGYDTNEDDLDLGCREYSSTEARRNLLNGSGAKFLCPLVELYIDRNGLYRRSVAA